MKKIAMITLSVAVLASTSVFSNAFAQETTRAQVRQELIQAENNGSRFVTDTSYPEVNQSTSDVGSSMSGSSASGQPASMNRKTSGAACVGPVDFCTPYFGS
jgi:hypothetical protein